MRVLKKSKFLVGADNGTTKIRIPIVSTEDAGADLKTGIERSASRFIGARRYEIMFTINEDRLTTSRTYESELTRVQATSPYSHHSQNCTWISEAGAG